MRIDLEKWSAERRSVEEALRALKRLRREPHQPRWRAGIDDRELLALAARATLLYRLRAHARGRVHLRGDELAAQGEALRGALAAFAAPGPA